jgi:alanine racemase
MNLLGKERCWAEIDRSRLQHNAQVAQERVGLETELLAVVKANGYGHGMVEVARALRNQAKIFGVANFDEAEELRGSGIAHPILILGPALPEERSAINERGFIPSVSSLEEALGFAGNRSGINFSIDTGMGRMGCWQDAAADELEKLSLIPDLKVHSVSTHLPVADEDTEFTQHELEQFKTLVNQLRARASVPFKVHALASAGIFGFSRHHFDIVRAGLLLYGNSPLPNEQKLLEPVMTLKTQVALLRDLPAGRSVSYGRTFTTARPTRVATLSAGYADGYPRSLSNRGAQVLIHGRRCAVVGRITMDLTMVDVTALPDVAVGDEVVLIGKQGADCVPAIEVAERAGTIAWEIFTGIGRRVRRVYL